MGASAFGGGQRGDQLPRARLCRLGRARGAHARRPRARGRADPARAADRDPARAHDVEERVEDEPADRAVRDLRGVYRYYELAKRAAFGHPIGVVYRLVGRTVEASIYSIGDVDVSAIARRYGGGGHRNASGFSVPLRRWLDEFC